MSGMAAGPAVRPAGDLISASICLAASRSAGSPLPWAIVAIASIRTPVAASVRRVRSQIMRMTPSLRVVGETKLEGDAHAKSNGSTFLEHPRILDWHPVQHVVAIDVLQVGATGAPRLGEVDQVFVTRLVHERVELIRE